MLASIALACLCAQGQTPAKAAPDPYPPVRPSSHMFFFALEGKPREDALKSALAELSTKEAECRLVRPPRSTAARKELHFAVVEAPASVGPKEIRAALGKGCSGSEQLAFTCFHGSNGRVGGSEFDVQPGLSFRDLVLGMSGDVRWFDELLSWRQFDHHPGKLDAKALAERYEKYMKSKGGGKIGKLVEEEFRWVLAEPLDAKSCERAEKSIAKLPGVARCRVDAAKRELTVGIRYEGLESSGPPLLEDQKLFGDKTPVRPRFDTLPVFDALDKEKLAVAPPAAPEGGK